MELRRLREGVGAKPRRIDSVKKDLTEIGMRNRDDTIVRRYEINGS